MAFAESIYSKTIKFVGDRFIMFSHKNKLTKTLVFSILLLATLSISIFAQQETTDKAKNTDAKKEETAKTPLAQLLASQPEIYTAKQVYTQGNGYVNTITYSQKGNWQRVDTEQNGMDMAVISRPDKDKKYIMVPSKQGYSELFGNSALFLRLDPFYLQQAAKLAPRNVKIESLGSEQTSGYNCDKYKISFDEANFVKTITIWKAKDLQGLIVRQDLDFLQFKDKVELQDVRLEVNESLFELPKDFKSYATSQEMFQQRPQQNP